MLRFLRHRARCIAWMLPMSMLSLEVAAASPAPGRASVSAQAFQRLAPSAQPIQVARANLPPGTDPEALVQDAVAHALLAIDAYTAGDFPTTRDELDAALDTLLAGDLPRGEAGLEYLQQHMPDSARKFNLVKVYREAQRKAKAVEASSLIPEGAAREKAVGGPQGVGEPAQRAVPGLPPLPPETENGKTPTLKDAELAQPLSDKDMAYVRKEIERIVSAFGEKSYPHPETFEREVANFIRAYQTHHRGFFERSLLRSVKYMDMVRGVLAEKNVPADMAYIAFVESGFRPVALSNAGAVGVWQFMPRTARAYGLRVDGKVDERLDPQLSTVAAREYFLDLVAIFGSSSFLLAIASYNAGEGKVQYCLKQVDDPFTQRTFWDIRSCLRQETREYIPRIIAAAIAAGDPKRFGFTEVADYIDPSRYALVEVPVPTSLSLLAGLAQVPVSTLRTLNPDLGPKDTTTPRLATYQLLVPKSRVREINSELAEIRARKAAEPPLVVDDPTPKPRDDVKVAQAPSDKGKKHSDADAEHASTEKAQKPEKSSEKSASSKTAEKPPEKTVSAEKSAEKDEKSSRTTEKAEKDEKTAKATEKAEKDEKSARTADKTEKTEKGSDKGEKSTRTASNSEKSEKPEKTDKSDKKASSASKSSEDKDSDDGDAADKRSRYVRYKVQKGNTLGQIAKDFGKTTSRLKEWNPYLSARDLKPGDIVFVYELDAGVSKAVHVATKSDTWEGVARKYGVTAEQVKRWNGGTAAKPGTGSSLVIYTRHQQADEPTVAAKPAPAQKAKSITYTVQAGNNLSIIAELFDVEIRDLMTWNHLKSGRIKAGDTLVIYPHKKYVQESYTVKKGDTVPRLAARYRLEANLLRAANGLEPDDLIKSGQKITVYRPVN